MSKPGPLHEGILEIFKREPKLLRHVMSHSFESGDSFAIKSENFAELSPSVYSPDLIIEMKSPSGAVVIYIVEVQLGVDDMKRWAWPLYTAAVHGVKKCLTYLVVLTPSQSVATWARKPISTFHPEMSFAPIVIGPDDLPRDVSDARISASPEFALLCALTHNTRLDLAIAAVEGISTLDEERGAQYNDILFYRLSPNTLRELEAMMQTGKVTYHSDFAKRHFREGLVEGREEGLVEGRRNSLHTFIEAREFALSAEQRALIKHASPQQLLGWIRRVAKIDRIDQLFE